MGLITRLLFHVLVSSLKVTTSNVRQVH